MYDKYIDGEVTKDEIKKVLVNNSSGKTRKYMSERELLVHKLDNSYGAVGTVVFSLEGSPAKAYALYVPEYEIIGFFDNRLRKFKDFKGVRGVSDLI